MKMRPPRSRREWTQPESVTVYAFPRQPYLICYERGGCVIAFLAVERAMLWRWLAPKLGWPA